MNTESFTATEDITDARREYPELMAEKGLTSSKIAEILKTYSNPKLVAALKFFTKASWRAANRSMHMFYNERVMGVTTELLTRLPKD